MTLGEVFGSASYPAGGDSPLDGMDGRGMSGVPCCQAGVRDEGQRDRQPVLEGSQYSEDKGLRQVQEDASHASHREPPDGDSQAPDRV